MSYLELPALQVPLPESPLPSWPVTLDPMSHVNPPQATYVHDFTHMLEFMNQNQAQFQEQITWAISALTGSWVTPPDSQVSHGGSTVKLHNPQVFNSCHEEVVPFLSEVQCIIEFHPSSFPDNHQIVMYLKDGIPIEWFNHLEVIGSPYLHNWLQFMSEFWKKFTDPWLSSTADQKLEKLKQTGSAHTYLTCFVKLSSHLEMTEQTKINCFMKGLKPAIKGNLVSIIDWPLTLMGWENIIIQVNANLHQWDLEWKDNSKGKNSNQKPAASMKSIPSTTPTIILLSVGKMATHWGFSCKGRTKRWKGFKIIRWGGRYRCDYSNTMYCIVYISLATMIASTSSTPDVIPMELDAVWMNRGKFTQEEHDHRFKNNLCLYCGKPGHLASSHKKKNAELDQGKPSQNPNSSRISS